MFWTPSVSHWPFIIAYNTKLIFSLVSNVSSTPGFYRLLHRLMAVHVQISTGWVFLTPLFDGDLYRQTVSLVVYTVPVQCTVNCISAPVSDLKLDWAWCPCCWAAWHWHSPGPILLSRQTESSPRWWTSSSAMSIGLSDFLSEGFLNVNMCPIFSKKRKIGRPIPLGRKIGQA